MWSGELTKINKRKRTQIRQFIITNQRFINFGNRTLKDKFVNLFKGSKVKREIGLEKITHITYSETSSQFILHVPSEYDYRLRTLDRDDFLLYLICFREKLKQPLVKIWLRPEINLEAFTKTENMKNTVCPSENPKEFSSKQF